ncbi:hypothetical protein J31TS4_02730 [Paenibacillus sp. J31TS4]|uniref:hypothetical protein n=1 Tax=Paenibacillus sp. J31TS4 TaxID=2807195 RepID=UPI001B27459E|nr:hypothetical protein [Paenibacillus sp. J31TS4]GIP36993.1 hypothetical protein J31TS4_02730 [Paenibacillus sp. J31TS4]
MIEMRGGKDLKYSNRVPGWAKVAQIVLIGLLACIGVGGLGLGVYFVVIQDWVGALFCFPIGGFILFITRIVYVITRFNNNIEVLCELRDEGYYTYFKDLKSGYTEEELIPFERMREVLIGRTTSYISSGSNSRGCYRVGAKIIMKSENEDGTVRYSMFGLGDGTELDTWMRKFETHGLPILYTPENVEELKLEDYESCYDEIPKLVYGEQIEKILVGHSQYSDLPVFRTSRMKEVRRAKQSVNDRKLFLPAYAVLLVFNLLVAYFWMPHWLLDDDMFADASPSAGIILMNIALLVFVGRYWRRETGWLRPLRDYGMLLGVHLTGGVLAVQNGSASPVLYDAIIVDNLSVLLFAGIILAVFQFRKWRTREKPPAAKAPHR